MRRNLHLRSPVITSSSVITFVLHNKGREKESDMLLFLYRLILVRSVSAPWFETGKKINENEKRQPKFWQFARDF